MAWGARRDGVDSPSVDAFSDAFGLDHDAVGSGLQTTARVGDEPAHVARSLDRKLRGFCGAACAELDAELGLRLQARGLECFDERNKVIRRQANESSQQLDEVEPSARASPTRHEGERASGVFHAIDILTHRF